MCHSLYCLKTEMQRFKEINQGCFKQLTTSCSNVSLCLPNSQVLASPSFYTSLVIPLALGFISLYSSKEKNAFFRMYCFIKMNHWHYAYILFTSVCGWSSFKKKQKTATISI